MVGAIGSGNYGNAWGQLKKIVDETTTTIIPDATQDDTSATSPAPETAPQPVVSDSPTADAPALTYSAPSSGPRQTGATSAPQTTLSQTLTDAGYYATPAAASVADPVATAQQEDGAALTQAQIIAQAAYAIVARAGEDERLTLIQQG